ncbi:hypothetical protein ACWD4N_44870, partial [Streptomyces sp. NPDC002586]
VGAARTALDTCALWWLWAALLIVWAPISPLILVVAVAGTVIAYLSLLTRASQYTELLVAVFDVHRALLYNLFGCAGPAEPSLGKNETAWGEALTTALWRGPSEAPSPEQISGAPDAPSGLRQWASRMTAMGVSHWEKLTRLLAGWGCTARGPSESGQDQVEKPG